MGANLQKANLTGANLNCAIMARAKLNGAIDTTGKRTQVPTAAAARVPAKASKPWWQFWG
jgi:uncharacterized protein YjbI with pentapeptide repeats